MKVFVLWLTALLCLSGQQTATDSSHRCAEVSRMARLLQTLKALPDEDLRAADTACEQYSTLVRNRQPEAARTALNNANAIMDRLGLTETAIFGRFEQAAATVPGLQRFYVLADLAKTAFNLGEIDKAEAFSRELLQETPKYPQDWNYGNALYYGNFVLGRIALRRGDTRAAGQYLIEAAHTPGSPQLNSFGPNVTLAKELLEKGVTAPVLEYFALCKNFWKMDRGQLDDWSAAVRGGSVPKFFGGNLNY
jgi:tetratricopeptide (TPR) repeat protein